MARRGLAVERVNNRHILSKSSVLVGEVHIFGLPPRDDLLLVLLTTLDHGDLVPHDPDGRTKLSLAMSKVLQELQSPYTKQAPIACADGWIASAHVESQPIPS
jgi:hypothetical protein